MQEPRVPGREVPAGTSPTPAMTSRNLVFDVTNWHPKPVKRPRPVKSCTECRRRKLRCDRRCPCSQCQRSYRICKYGSGDGSNSRGIDANGSLIDSDGSEGGYEDDDSMSGGGAGERPLKRHSSRPISGTTPQPVAVGISQPPQPFNSSLSLLLNPPSPSSSPSTLRAPSLVSSSAPAYASSAPPFPTPSYASVPVPMRIAAVSTAVQSPLLTLNGHELRQFTSDLIDEFSTRMERLEKLVLAKDSSALSSIPPFPSSSTLSQLHLHQQPDQSGPHIIDPSSPTMRCLTVNEPGGLESRVFGQNSTRALLNLFDEAKDFISDQSKRDVAGDLFSSLERAYNALRDEHQQVLRPITVFVDSMMPVQKRMADILPRRDVCDRLLDAYISMTEGLYRVIHIPSFRREYEAYWDNGGASGISNIASVPTCANGPGGISTTHRACAEVFLPRLLCIMCIGSRFETDSKGLCYDRSDGVHIPTACSLVRSWLETARRRQSTDLHTLQAELLLQHASRMIDPHMLRTWNELGLISRTAMAMGLHRDPSEFPMQMSPFHAEFRRKLWHTIMDMDLHVALASSLPTAMREGEFTCKPPRNLDDVDLYPEMTTLPQAKPMDQYTDGQMQAYAACTLPLRMRANDILCRIDSVRDYGKVLAVGGELEKALDDINCLFPRNAALGTGNKYKAWRMRALLDMHVRRPLVALYRPFALSASPNYPPPTAITDVYLKSSMALLTYMEELDPNIPGFDDVSHMYHVILRHDIVQAAFSVCFYIRQALEAEESNNTTPSSGGSTIVFGGTDGGQGVAARGGRKLTPDDVKVSGHIGSHTPTSAPFAPMAAVSDGGNSSTPAGNNGGNKKRVHSLIWSATYMIRTVERTTENLARLAGDLSNDLRDVVALAVVLGSVKPAANQIQRNENIRAQVGRVRDACFDTLRRHASPAIRALVSAPDVPLSHVPDWYNRPTLQNELAQPTDESALLDMGFWDVWDMRIEAGAKH
ncbi:c6 zinc finger domain containing protein [Grosmannia clavigera kw1407]|uniref:C6 zinc finger domain containing protein n=1 Tax=Grosmannia clavigera (strain kw1407 / UAMH 11150) TaxID=655863 RepID=F0X7H3_GROCL|nr:c6 zinc finger domain containing protein [Grosmannia clavigera kw1407]EFX06233.1 c6 zinc finger domain containing protein [Grosmannia clavigera kw1407]